MSTDFWLIFEGGSCRYQQTAAMPEKVEVFVDDQKILVDPGTTVLQVGATLVIVVYIPILWVCIVMIIVCLHCSLANFCCKQCFDDKCYIHLYGVTTFENLRCSFKKLVNIKLLRACFKSLLSYICGSLPVFISNWCMFIFQLLFVGFRHVPWLV